MTADVSVVILNWNGLEYLDTCLSALEAQSYRDFEVILVDNGSTDGSVPWVTEHYPQVRLIRNRENRGFAAANNQAIRASSARFVATLNNDTRAEPNWLAALTEAMEQDPAVGMCSSKMLFADQPEVIDSTGISMDALGIAWDRHGGALDDATETKSVEVFGPCAGAALYRRAMLDQIGLFDEGYFIYLEDVDLAWRARLAGWRCLHVPSARVYHIHSATMREGSPFKNRLLGRNKIWTIAKNYPLGRLLLHLPLILFYDLAAVVYSLVVRRESSSLQGRLEGFKGLPRVWRERRAIQALQEGNRGRPWHHYLSPMVAPWRVPARYEHLGAGKTLHPSS